MDRRKFIKWGGAGSLSFLKSLNSLASCGLHGTTERDKPVKGEKVALSNRYLEWDLAINENGVRSVGLNNKLTGRYFPFTDSSEIVLAFSQAKARIEIPWWNSHLGPDNDPSPPESEEGYLKGYHLDDLDDGGWTKVCNLLLFDLNDFRTKKVFNGYAWFRCWFELDRQAKGDEVVLCLGGYDLQDWNQYWVYMNGTYVGHRSSSGRWRTPGEFTIRPDSPNTQLCDLVRRTCWRFVHINLTRGSLGSVRIFQIVSISPREIAAFAINSLPWAGLTFQSRISD